MLAVKVVRVVLLWLEPGFWEPLSELLGKCRTHSRLRCRSLNEYQQYHGLGSCTTVA